MLTAINNTVIINKKVGKIQIFFFTGYFFFVKICWHCFCWNSLIPPNYWVINNTWIFFTIFATTFSKIPNIIFFAHMFFRFFHSHQHLPLFHVWFELLFLPSNLHLHLHDICFVNVFDSFIPVIMLKTLRFKSSLSFGTNTLLDRSLRVLQLPTYLSKWTTN